jgi:hypothetical protein
MPSLRQVAKVFSMLCASPESWVAGTEQASVFNHEQSWMRVAVRRFAEVNAPRLGVLGAPNWSRAPNGGMTVRERAFRRDEQITERFLSLRLARGRECYAATDQSHCPKRGEAIMKLRTGVCITSLLLLAGSALAQSEERRFRLIPLEEMTAEQRTVADAIRSGPRASVAGSSANAATPGSPFNPWLRSPEAADLLQRLGSYLRFKARCRRG